MLLTSFSTFRYTIFVILWVALALPPSAGAQNAAHVWIADHKNLKRIDLGANQVDLTIALDREAKALAVDPAADVVWALTEKKQLSKFDSTGQSILQVDLTGLVSKLDEPKHLALNPYDASLWVAGEKVVLHVDAQGRRLGAWEVSDEIQAMGLDVDESLWLLAHKELLHLSPQGTVLQNPDLKSYVKEPEYLAVDSLGGLLWIADKKELIRLESNHLDQAPRSVTVPDVTGGDDKKILALAVDPLMGNLWVVTKQNLLFIYDREANLLKTVDFGSHDLGETETAVFEPVSASFWLGGKKAVARFASNGDFIARIVVDKDAEALGVAPFRLLPTLALLEPENGDLTNNPRPPIRLGFGSSCNAIPCLMPEAYRQSLLLDVMLNGLAIGNLFTISHGEAYYTPSQRLPEGVNLFTAQATDLFGHHSDKLNSRFTLDTVPPKFLSISPADGSAFTTPAVTIQGTLDDATAGILLLDDTGNVISMGNGAAFRFDVTLAPGPNTFSLTARDPAGNETMTVLHLRYAAVTVTLANPQPNASLTSTSLDVNGNFQGPPNTGITVNGIVAMIHGDQFFANLDLDPGANTLAITATTPDGATVTKTITVMVTASAPDPVQIAVSPQGGVAPLAAQFTVTNNSGLGIQRIEADFDGNGTADFTTTDPNAAIAHTYANPGVYAATITVTDGQGTVYSRSLTVVVDDAAQRDRLYGTLWSGMNSALAAGNIAGANLYLNANAQRHYQPMFQALQPHLAEIVASYSPLQRVSISENIGEYAVNRTDQGQNRLYLIYFLRDADGVWRVDAM